MDADEVAWGVVGGGGGVAPHLTKIALIIVSAATRPAPTTDEASPLRFI
jgi:hypothetical protein